MVTYCCDFVVSQGGLLGWDIFLNSLLRVGCTRGFFFVVFGVTLLLLLLCCFCCYFVVSVVTLLFLRDRAGGRTDGRLIN